MKRSILLCLVLLVFTSCAEKLDPNNASGTDTSTGQTITGLQRITVMDASVLQCAAGGKVYSIYLDLNANNLQDLDEETISAQTVCNGMNGANGTNGSNGLTTLFGMSRVSVSHDVCAAGSGVQLSSGLDLNFSGVLNATEITQTQVLCDGLNGSAGAAGPAGSNGHSVAFQISAASAEVCPAGGSIIAMALDITDRGSYSSADPHQQAMILCNGVNGQNAQASAYAPMDLIMPCGNTASLREVLLRLSNGLVLGAYSENANGQNTRLALLTDGNYKTTDGSKCSFSLSTSKNIRSVSWEGKEQMQWEIQL